MIVLFLNKKNKIKKNRFIIISKCFFYQYLNSIRIHTFSNKRGGGTSDFVNRFLERERWPKNF